MSDAITIHDAQFNIIAANAAARELLALSPQVLGAGTKCFRRFHGADAPPADCPSCRCLERGAPVVSEIYEPHLSRHLEVRAFPRLDDRGAIIGLVHVVRDITERKETERQAASMLSMLESTLEATADGILLVNGKGRIIRSNERFREMWKIPPAIVASQDDNQALAFVLDQLKDPEEFLNTVRRLYDAPEATSFDELHFKDGRVFERYSQPQRVGPDVVGRVWSFRDVTDRRRTEDQLLQSQRMESIGRLAGGVAHDFNNMLGVILGHTEILLDTVPFGSPIHSELTEIQSAAERSTRLTGQLLAFARRQPILPVVLDVNQTIAHGLNMLRRLIGEDIDVVWRPGDGLPPVKMDPGQIDQVLANLCVNARDAIGGVGTVAIATEDVDIDATYCEARPELAPGRYVRLTISDSGCGMAPETQAHVFEPFFTTKAPGAGTGLGLSTVYGIVTQNGGFIDVYSRLGQGTTFTICLPAHEGPVQTSPAPQAPALTRAGHETILLVEDEPSLLSLNTRTLESLGYRVLAAGTPAEAIRIARAHDGRIHLLLSDVVMPGMNGLELRVQVCAIRPDTRSLFCSGYTTDVIRSRGLLEGGAHFLQKPFNRAGLATKVREVLDGPA